MNSTSSASSTGTRPAPLHALMYVVTLGIAVIGALSISLAAHAEERHERFEGHAGHELRVEHFARDGGRDFARDRDRFVIGHRIDRLPERSIPLVYRGAHFYVNNGVWFRAVGNAFIVAAAPIGALVPVLPFGYATRWVHGTRYYLANDVYYVSAGASLGYRVVAPPVFVGAASIQAAPL